MLQVEKRFSQNYSARVSYTLAYSQGNTSGAGAPASPFQVLDDLNLDLNEGPTNFDQRHNFVVSGTAMVPHTGGLTVSWVARALSGTPLTIFDATVDTDRNGTLADPLPAGTTPEPARCDHGRPIGSRNGAYGPDYFKLDLRLGYRLKVGGPRTLDLFGEIFNLTDRANFANPTGDRLRRTSSAHRAVDQLQLPPVAARRALCVLTRVGRRRGVRRKLAPFLFFC